MSTTTTSNTTEMVNGTTLADVREESEGKGTVEQGKEPVSTTDDLGEYPKRILACHGVSGSRFGRLPSRSGVKYTGLES